MSTQENNLIRGVALNNGQVGQIDYNFLANQPTIKGQPAAGELSEVLALKGETSEIHTGSDEPPASAKVWIDPNGDEAVSLPETVEQVVKEYMEENPVSLPEKLPNPYKLILTGAVDAEYDGSEEIKVEIPEGGSGIPVPETAEVGQTIVVKAVDENGKPTEWEAADLPSGGLKTHLETIVDYTFDGTTTLSTAEGLSEYILHSGQKAVWNKDNSGNLLKAIRLWGFVHCTQATTAEKDTNSFVLCGCARASTYADIPSSWWYGDDVGNGVGTYALTDTYVLNNVTVSQGRASGGWCDHSLGVGVINTAVGSPSWRSNLKASVPPKVTLDKVSPNYYKDYIYAATLFVESGSYIVPQGVRIVVVAEVIDE